TADQREGLKTVILPSGERYEFKREARNYPVAPVNNASYPISRIELWDADGTSNRPYQQTSFTTPARGQVNVAIGNDRGERFAITADVSGRRIDVHSSWVGPDKVEDRRYGYRDSRNVSSIDLLSGRVCYDWVLGPGNRTEFLSAI